MIDAEYLRQMHLALFDRTQSGLKSLGEQGAEP